MEESGKKMHIEKFEPLHILVKCKYFAQQTNTIDCKLQVLTSMLIDMNFYQPYHKTTT